MAALAQCAASTETPSCLSGSIQVPPMLTVYDDATGQPICDAIVLVTSRVVANGGSGAAVELAATQDAAPWDGAAPIILRPVVADGSSACSYDTSDAGLLFSIQVSCAGYETVEVSNIHATDGPIACAGVRVAPAPQIVRVTLSPDGA
jgi:hypothetical protein